MSEPARLRDDGSTPPALREALGEAATATPPYDATAGFARFEASVGAGSSSAGRWLPRIALAGAAVAVVVGLAAVAARFAPPSHVAPPAARSPAPTAAPLPGVYVPAPSDVPPSTTTPAAEEAAAVETPTRARARGGDPLTLELRLVVEARRYARTVPSRSLALLARADREVGTGVLGREREILRIEALIAVGRTDEAARRARAFLAAHPGDPLERRARGAIEAPR